MLDPREITINPHQAREVFRRHGIPLKKISRALDLSYNYVVAILSGGMRPTPETERKLKELCEILERD